MKNFLKNNIRQVVKIIIFLIFLSLLFWNRVFRQLLPRDLLTLEYNSIFFSTTIISVIIFFSLSITSFIILFKIPIKISHKKSSYIFMTILKEYFINASDALLTVISKRYDLNNLLTNKFSYIVVHYYYPRLIVSLFLFSPTLILAIIFFIEVIYYHYIFFFYKLLWLLFIPLSAKAIIYVMDQISTNQIQYVTAHLVCEKRDNQLLLQLAPVSPDIENALSLKEMSLLFDWLVTQYEIHCNIKNFCDDLNSFKNSYMSLFMLIYGLLYLISWLYILVVNLSIITTIPEVFLWKDNIEPFSQTLINSKYLD